MDDKELPQPNIEQQPRERGLKFSGRTLASPEHPNKNDDAIAVSEQGGFVIVCDGMGGIPDGDKASRAARNFLGQRLAEIRPDVHPNAVGEKMQKALVGASRAVASEAPRGATTATAVKFLERGSQRKIVIGHVGDSNSKGERIVMVRAGDPQNYAARVREMRATWLVNLKRYASHKEIVENIAEGIRSADKQMIGFGKAALDVGDIRAAALAFEAAEVLKNPQIRKSLYPLAASYRGGIRQLFADLGIAERDPSEAVAGVVPKGRPTPEASHQPARLRERPKRRILQGEAPTLNPSGLYRTPETTLVELKHSGTNRVYFVGGENGRSIVKFANMDQRKLWRLKREVDFLKAANGTGGLPRLEVVLQDIGDSPRGIQIERIQGKSMNDIPVSELTPDKFGLDNRLWFIYDLVEAYKAIGVVHGDLMQTKREHDGSVVFTINRENMILENSTGRIRVIDWGLNEYPVSNIFYPKSELKGAIEYLFMGREVKGINKSLPSNPYIQRIGQQMLSKLDQVQNINEILSIIPPEARIPGEQH